MGSDSGAADVNGWVATIPCPECGHGSRDPELNTVLGFYLDGGGCTIGQRVHCMRCEHVWDDMNEGP